MVAAAPFVVGWAFWLHRMGINDHDDMLSNELLFARQGLATLLFHNPWPDQSPLYFVYLHALRTIGESPFVVQFANAALLSVALGVTYLLARDLSGSRSVATASVFIGAVSPTSLWLVRNGRMYSLQLLFSILASLFVIRFLQRRRHRDLVAFALVSALNIYTHFFGFLITGLLFAALLFDAWRTPAMSSGEPSLTACRRLRAPLYTVLALAVVALPQVLRLVSFVTQSVPAARADVSLPALSPRFFDRVSWFWFVNADWGTLRPGEQLITAVYVGSIVVLAIAGLTAAGRRLGGVLATWIVVPLAVVGLAAGRIDLRDRYFVWTLPLLWVAVANGALGAMPSSRLTESRADIARGIRAALVVGVMVGSLWLLWNKLPERYSEWTKLMGAVERLYRPSMLAYMPPGSPMGIPRLIAVQGNMPDGLRNVRELSANTRDQFLQEVERQQEFIFFVYNGLENDEMRSRIRYLESRGYEKASIPTYGAGAQLFTRTTLDGWSQTQRIDPSSGSIVSWARQQLTVRSGNAGSDAPLGSALVARVDQDGTARMGQLFVSQRGEYGSWRLGPEIWDAVEDQPVTSGQIEQRSIAAHPASGSVLVVALPARAMGKSLALSYGIADTGIGFRGGANVDIAIYVNGVRHASLSCPNTPGWKQFALDTALLEGQPADTVLLLTTADDRSRHFAFRVDPSSVPAVGSAAASDDRSPFILTGAHRLSDTVERLRVYRLDGNRQIDSVSDGQTYSASDMHEATGNPGEGSVHRVWALGPPLWDAVGSTRQRSAGEIRKGIWAHPRDGTTLVIEALHLKLGELLRGEFGFTDHGVQMAASAGVTAPLNFRIALDGRTVFDQNVARTAGWSALAVSAGDARGERSLRIEIASAADKWGHFVFDLWSD
jgi:hypothetical protein